MGLVSAIVMGGAAIVGGVVQAKAGKKAAKKAAAAQEAAYAGATEESRRQYEEEKEFYKPVREKAMEEAMSDIPTGYTRQAAAIEGEVAQARKSLTERPYGSGLLQSSVQNLALKEAEGKAGAYGVAMDRQLALRHQLAAQGTQVVRGAGSAYAEAAQKQGMAMGDLYGQQADAARKAEAQGWNTAIQGVGSMAGSIYGAIPNKVTTTATNYIPAENMKPLPTVSYENLQNLNPVVYTPNYGFSYVNDPYKIN